MSAQSGRKPLPHEHKEIAQGSGAAAILLFLHIAISGYLGSVAYYLARYNTEMFWQLVPFRAVLLFYLPAAFALATFLPTNPLTRVVARVAMAMGVVAVVTYAVGLGWLLANEGGAGGYTPGWITVLAVVCGGAGGWVMRSLFGHLMRKVEELS